MLNRSIAMYLFTCHLRTYGIAVLVDVIQPTGLTLDTKLEQHFCFHMDKSGIEPEAN